MNIDSALIQSIKEKTNIVDIVNDYVPLKHTGSSYKACCPFHNEKTPSFNVNETKQIFKCFGCGVSGDVIKFIELIENVEFLEALKILSEKLGIEIKSGTSEVEIKRYKDISTLKEINTEVARHFYLNLKNSQAAKNYLYSRGITLEMIKTFGIGYAGFDTDYIKLLEEKYTKDMILKSGVVIAREGNNIPRFKNRLMFPIFNSSNYIIGFGGRQLENYGPKYLNSPETEIFLKKDNLYGYNLAKKNIEDSTIFLVEGYLDVIKMHQFGFKNTVASLGTAFTREQGQLINKIAKNLIILYDSDAAGLEASKRALDISTDLGINTSVLILKGAKDPDEFLSKNGKEAFINALSDTYDYVSFNIEFIRRIQFSGNDRDMEKFIISSVDFLKKYISRDKVSHILVEKAIIRLANYTGYSINSIGKDVYGKYYSPKQFNKLQNKRSSEDFPMTKLSSDLDDINSKEKRLLSNIQQGNISSEEVTITDFSLKENRKLYYDITHQKDVEMSLDSFEQINLEDSISFIKNIRNNRLDNLINYFKSIQDEYLKKDTNEALQNALIIGQFIINLNVRKNK